MGRLGKMSLFSGSVVDLSKRFNGYPFRNPELLENGVMEDAILFWRCRCRYIYKSSRVPVMGSDWDSREFLSGGAAARKDDFHEMPTITKPPNLQILQTFTT